MSNRRKAIDARVQRPDDLGAGTGLYTKIFAEAVGPEGEVYAVDIGPLTTANYFKPGHALRIEVSSSNFPRFTRNLNTGGNNYDETEGVVANNQVHHTAEYPSLDLQVHIHDTRNMGMVNTLAAVELGVDKVQSTLGGLGGCPFAPGASGNLATEDLAFMLSEMGYELDVDIPKMIELAKYQAAAIPSGLFSGHQFRIPDTND